MACVQLEACPPISSSEIIKEKPTHLHSLPSLFHNKFPRGDMLRIKILCLRVAMDPLGRVFYKETAKINDDTKLIQVKNPSTCVLLLPDSPRIHAILFLDIILPVQLP